MPVSGAATGSERVCQSALPSRRTDAFLRQQHATNPCRPCGYSHEVFALGSLNLSNMIAHLKASHRGMPLKLEHNAGKTASKKHAAGLAGIMDGGAAAGADEHPAAPTAQTVRDALMLMVILDDQPVSFVDRLGFNKFYSMLVRPFGAPPLISRMTLDRHLLSKK